jgi:hypothetical protein
MNRAANKKVEQALIEEAVKEAFQAAKQASAEFLANFGDRDCCGFAWVEIKPANCKLANYLKKNGHGRSSCTGGLTVWDPGKTSTQALSVKEAGAVAFATVLRDKLGANAWSNSRMD